MSRVSVVKSIGGSGCFCFVLTSCCLWRLRPVQFRHFTLTLAWRIDPGSCHAGASVGSISPSDFKALGHAMLFFPFSDFATACYWRHPQSHALLAVGGCSDSSSSRQQLVAAQDVASAVMCTGPWVGFLAGLAQARFYPSPF